MRETHLRLRVAFRCSSEGSGIRREVSSMPGVFQLSVDEAVKEAAAAKADGVPGVLLFGLPERKDAVGSLAADPEAPVQSAVREMKRHVPDLVVITDVCLCEHTRTVTAHSRRRRDCQRRHGVAPGAGGAVARGGGADFVAPSDMMDGRVARSGSRSTPTASSVIMSYANTARPSTVQFREAADSAPQFGDRRSHQMDPANVEEALREVETDLAEGADIIMVKPAMTYLDVIAKVKMRFNQPMACRQRLSRAKRRVRERLARRAAGDDGNADRDPARRRAYHRQYARDASRRSHAATSPSWIVKSPSQPELFEQARQILPGGVDSPVRAFQSVGGIPLFIKRASGAIEDVDGNRFIDYVMSWGR